MLGLHGKLVFWSKMSGEDPVIKSVPVLFTGKSLHGFWIMNWLKMASRPCARSRILWQRPRRAASHR
jgi:hypothetical protein